MRDNIITLTFSFSPSYVSDLFVFQRQESSAGYSSYWSNKIKITKDTTSH